MPQKTFAALFVIISAIFIPLGSVAQAAPQLQTTNRVYVTNVWENGFTVSWTTDTASDGHVDYDTVNPPTGSTVSDAIVSTTTHYVDVSGLSPNTTYLFQIRSGATTDNNGGAYYSVTTGSSLVTNPSTHNLFGYLYESNGTTLVPNAIVYLQIQDVGGLPTIGNSVWASARTDVTGIWFYNLNNIRTTDGSARFGFTQGADNVRLIWQGGVLGIVGEVGNEDIRLIPATNTQQIDMNLDNNPTAIQMRSFGAHSQTAAAVWVWIGVTLLTIFILIGIRLFAVNGRWRFSYRHEI
ncbi:MAG: fibronectin type III domain-containing protein [Chloroflexi bacterium]|nr:fibronectin type III domain-containing protein [Chloroflexota bacterium]